MSVNSTIIERVDAENRCAAPVGCRWFVESVLRAIDNQFTESADRPAFRVGGGVAEEVEEEGLGEGVELGEGGAALGPQRLRPVQHLRNPPLLRQRRQGERIQIREELCLRLTCCIVVPVKNARFPATAFSNVSRKSNA